MTNDWIAKSLDSIRNSNHPLQTVVVDNSSTDETVSFIEKEYSEVIVFPQDKNLGFGQANNVGMRYALSKEADYVFLLNQDAYLEPETISLLVEAHYNHPEYGILSPIHLNGTGEKLDRNFSEYVSYDKNNYFYSDAILKQLSGVYKVPFVNAAAWLIPRSTLEVIGGFDPIFFHYGEDNNYCQRALYHNLEIGVLSNSYVYHDRKRTEPDEELKKDLISLNRLEVRYKSQYANINSEIAFHKFEVKLKFRKKSFLKKRLLLFSKNRWYWKKELEMLKRISLEMDRSRKINSTKGSHYLY